MADEIPTNDSPEAALNAFVDEEPEEKPEREARAEEDTEERETKGDDDAEPEKDKAEKEPPRTYKAKVNGRETEVPAEQVDVLAKALGVDPGVIVRGAQMFRAGQDKAREASDLVKKAEAMQARIKSDPRAVLREVVGDEEFRKLAVTAVREMMEEDELRTANPAELERRRAAADLEKLKAEKAALSKESEDREAAAYQDKVASDLSGQIKSALESGKLPKDPYIVRRLASYIHDHVSSENVDDLSIEDYLPVVLEEMQAEHSAFLGKLSGEDIIDRFPEMADKVRQAFTKRVRRPSAPMRQPERREESGNGKAKPNGYGARAALDAFVKG